MIERDTTKCTWFGGPFDGQEIDIQLGLSWVRYIIAPATLSWRSLDAADSVELYVPIVYRNGGWVLDWTEMSNE